MIHAVVRPVVKVGALSLTTVETLIIISMKAPTAEGVVLVFFFNYFKP